MLKDIRYEKRDGVARITLDRPEKRNAVRPRTLQELLLAYEDAAFDGDVRVIVSTGAGSDAFCAGGDLDEFARAGAEDDGRTASLFCEIGLRLSNAMRLSPKPIVAAVNGACVGWGNEYLVFHDVAVAVDTATFSQPEMRLGSSPIHGLNQLLAGLIGDKRAREFILFRKTLAAPEAAALGFVNQAVPAEELDAAVADYCARILEASPQSVKLTKTMMNTGSDLLHAAQTLGFRAWTLLPASPQWQAALEAFRRDETPSFSAFKSL